VSEAANSDQRAGDPAVALGLALTAAVLHAPLILRTVGGCDEWHLLTAGARLAAGEVMYRDVTHIAGPVSFYLAAALFRLFGVHFVVARVTMLAVFAAMTAVLYLLARRLTSRTPAVLVGLWFIAFQLWCMPHWQMMHYASLGLFFVTAAFLTLGAERPARAARTISAGLLAGLAVLTKQDSGALGTIGCAAALLLARAARRRDGGPPEPRTPLVLFAAAAATPVVVAITYFAAHKALWPFFLQTVYDTLVQHPLFVAGGGPEQIDYVPLPRLFPLFSQDDLLRGRLLSYVPGMFWDLHWRDVVSSRLFHATNVVDLAIKLGFRLPYLVLVAELIATARAWRYERSGLAVGARAAHVAFATAIIAALSKPRDWIHLSVVVIPLAPIAARQLAALAGRLPAGGRRGFRVALASAGAVYLGLTLELGINACATYTAPIAGPRGTAYARPEDATPLQRVIDALSATPAERPVMAVPCVSAATFLAGRPSLSRFPWLWPRDAHFDRDQQVLASLDAAPEATLVYTLSHIPTIPRLQNHAPILFAGLAERYQMGPIFGPDSLHLIITIAERRSPSPEADVVSLLARLDEARAERVRQGTAVPLADTRDVAGVGTWALTPRVLWIAPSDAGETRLALPVHVPLGARLRLRAGVNPDLWQTLGPFPVRLRVSVESDGKSTELLDVRRDVYGNPADRRWVPLDADLGAFAEREVRVVLGATAEGWPGRAGEVAGFEDPRLVR
jgi:hypothetical protein